VKIENFIKENTVEKASKMLEEVKTKYKLKQVKSSNIKAIGYKKELKELFVLFVNNGFYKYVPVEEEIYDSFFKSESIGKFFFSYIKSNTLYKYEKLKVESDNIEIEENK
jgi:hypothetical protein